MKRTAPKRTARLLSDRKHNWSSVALVLSLFVIGGNGYCGEFYGEAVYLSTSNSATPFEEACLVQDGLRICLEPGIIPSSTREFAVGISVSNETSHTVVVRSDDFSLVEPTSQRRYPRRKSGDFKRIMRRLAWGDAVIRQSMKYSFDNTFSIVPSTTVTKLLRFYDPGNPSSKRTVQRFGERFMDLFHLEMPITLKLAYRDETVAEPRLHLLRYLGSDSTFMIHKKYGFEHEYLTAKPFLAKWKAVLPVKAYWSVIDGRRKLIEFTDQRFEITEQDARTRFSLGRFVFDESNPARVTIQESPDEKDSGKPFTELLDAHQACTLEKNPENSRLTCSDRDVWNASSRGQ